MKDRAHFDHSTVVHYAAQLVSAETLPWYKIEMLTPLFFFNFQITAIQIIHKCGIIHRDIKPANILIGNDGHLVIADFGLAKIFPADTRRGDDFPLLWPYPENPYICDKHGGTPGYTAPEITAKQIYSFGIDYFAVGVIIYQMITGSVCFAYLICAAMISPILFVYVLDSLRIRSPR